MVEVQHRRLEVRRQKPGGMPGADGAYNNVEEAVSKLRNIVGWRKRPLDDTGEKTIKKEKETNNSNKRVRDFDDDDDDANPIVQTRMEPELKTHTSYLLFATLPPPWTAADEEAAKARVETERAKFVVERESNGLSTWKRDKEGKKRGKYGPPPGAEVDAGGGQKGMTRKERKKWERAEKYRRSKEEQVEEEGDKVEVGSE